jgi:tetratricopeptide (TPR) repeat protein
VQSPERSALLILILLLYCSMVAGAQEDDGISLPRMMDIAEQVRLNPDSSGLQSLIAEMESGLPQLLSSDSTDWVNQMLAPGKHFRNSAPQKAHQYFGALHAEASALLPGNPGLIRIRAFEAEANLKAGQLYPALTGFEDCLEKLERRINTGSRVDSSFAALLYHKAGNMHFRLWDRRQAEAFLERSIVLNGYVGRTDRVAKAICDRNLIWLQDGRPAEVVDLAQEWINNPATPDLQKGILLSQLAEASFLLGDRARFEREAEKATATFLIWEPGQQSLN